MVDSNNENSFEQSLPEYKQGIEPLQSVVESTKLLKLPVIGRMLRERRILSAPSKIKIHGEKSKNLEDRPLATRRLRKEFLDEISNTAPAELNEEQEWNMKVLKAVHPGLNPDEEQRREAIEHQIGQIIAEKNAPRRKIIDEARTRDKLAHEFLHDQQEVRVDMGELGEQMAQCIVLPAPDQEKARQKPPIFLIAGIANDLENMGILPQKIAEERNVVMLAFPPAWRGEITEGFKDAAQASETYEPHTTFFKRAIEKLKADPKVREQIGDFDKFDLWGHSEGSVITAQALTDPDFRQQVANAAIICPPNCVDLGWIGLGWAVAMEYWNALRPKRFKDAPKRNVINRETITVDREMRERKKKVYNALVAKSMKKDKWWNRDMQVSEGGKITVVSYDSDRMTKSYKAVSEIRQNPRLNVVELSGSHETDLIDPEPLIAALK